MHVCALIEACATDKEAADASRRKRIQSGKPGKNCQEKKIITEFLVSVTKFFFLCTVKSLDQLIFYLKYLALNFSSSTLF